MAESRNRLFSRLAKAINAEGVIATSALSPQALAGLDSDGLISVVDSDYVQLRQVDIFRDSAFITNIVDTAYINSLVTIPEGFDSANALAAVLNAGYTQYDSANTLGLIDSAYINARVVIPEAGVDSATVISIITDANFTKYDSTNTIGILSEQGYLTSETTTSLSINANVLTFTDETGTDTDIDLSLYLDDTNLARIVSGTLDGNYIATFTRDDATTFTVDFSSLLNTYDSTNTVGIINTYGYTTYDSTNAASQIEAYGYLTSAIDSTNVVDIIDSAYVNARVVIPEAGVDSASVINIVTDANFTKYDSTNTISILSAQNYATQSYVTSTVDSDYVNARVSITTQNGISSVSQYDFVADSGQTVFNNVSFTSDDNIQVFLNGILLKGTTDYTTSNNNTVTLVDAADSGDELRLIAFETYSQRVSLDDYNYTATASQTTFSGNDDDGNSLTYTPGNVQVHLNGIMLRETADYAATTGTSVVLTTGASAGDTVTITAISGDSTYNSNLLNSYVSGITDIIDSAYVNARVEIPAAFDSADALNAVANANYTTYDSTNTIGIVDSAYVNARVEIPAAFDSADALNAVANANYTTYDSTNTIGILVAQNYASETFVTNQINGLIDGAPATLDTLNEIAAALNDDDSAYGTLINLIGEKTNYDSANAAAQIETYGYTTYDSTNTINLIDSAYVQARVTLDGTGLDSASVVSIIASNTNSFQAVASGNLPNGAPVVVNTDGTVSFAQNVQAVTEDIGTPVVYNANFTFSQGATYDPNSGKIVIVYRQSNSGPNYGIVGTVSGTSISFGTPVQFETGQATEFSVVYDTSAQKVVIAYRLNNALRAVVGTVSGTSISFGTPVEAVSSSFGVGDVAMAYHEALERVVIAIGTYENPFYRGRAIVGEVSGNSITFGFANIFEYGRARNTACVYDANAQKVVIAYEDNDDSQRTKAVVTTVNASTNGISFGSIETASLDASFPFEFVYDANAQKVVLFYLRTVGWPYAVVGTVSGTDISFGSNELIVSAASGNTNTSTAQYIPHIQKFIVAYRDQTNNDYLTYRLGTVSGTSISFTSAQVLSSVEPDFVTSVYDINNKKIVVNYRNVDNSSYGTSIVYQPETSAGVQNLTVDNFVGLSAGSYSNAQTATVQTAGAINEAQSGLTPGLKYYVQDNGTLGTAEGGIVVVAGTAIASNKIIVKG